MERLRALFPSNPRLDLYLGALGELRGTGAPLRQSLGLDPQTGANRGSIEFAAAPLALPDIEEGPQWLVRVDHHQSDAHRLSWRYIRDSRLETPNNAPVYTVNFPGFILDSGERNQNFLFTDSCTFGPSFTNEFRFSYGRLDVDQSPISARSVPLAHTLPLIRIPNISAPGVDSAQQFRHAHNLLFQETQTKLTGGHTFRYGAELLRQLATQRPLAIIQGEIRYTSAADYSAFANFLDDYGGPGARILRTIGAKVFHPNQFRQTYFFQDTWKATPSLTLTLGLRYENFGQVANVVRYPAFAGFDPDRFFEPNKVNRDDNNFGPAFGLAWSPSLQSGWLAKLFGNRRTVWRGGYQISYQALYTVMLSLNLATTTPNAVFVDIIGPSGPMAPRGDANWFARLPAPTLRPPMLSDAQQGAIEKNLRSP
ncbi:MAG: TonB-dependent receptor domain-containing protein, partial [Anaerolineales bacterium]